MSNPNTRKSCVVPKCNNTTINSPEKLFFIVPKEVKMRKKWTKAMKRLDPFGDKSTVYCCEDHFDIENDMENYIKYKLVGGRIKLKQSIVPHKFKCQQGKEDKPQRFAIQKRNSLEYFEKLLNKDETSMLEKPVEIFVVSCEDEIVIKDPLSFGNNDQCLEILKRSKGVQVNLKAKGVHKSTMTVNKCLKKKRNIKFSPDAV
ncbi:uncharacterized protein LOC128199571 [Bicyclus anynana]|uniref:Uncharacterized protein LOC128199571 n=1 Tax=Bicyclus anynana TaxID=110368 RepID=A0ABM3M294_BICAN|nr:uncharacterized protein LOC128199571 [Bicyclus anynana]